jgi:hypothetical protein
MLNTFIYSLRNRDMRRTLKSLQSRAIWTEALWHTFGTHIGVSCKFWISCKCCFLCTVILLITFLEW